ncbi:PrgI family protein [Halobacillus litoralis]|uniref:PrgI family protein n=1 Tax=Halobacillus litoralis TaxID=45668 RepID=A0A410MJB0_9BACI|nr:PrgI family protein [Halobacillus litoralis]QAS54780.1 PrgI family protein [Halobacillus litoralis]
MTRKVTVPIDMSSEQKTILGILSKRQLIYLIVGGLLIYSYTPVVYGLGPTFYIGALLCIFAALPVVAIVGVFGFLRKHKYNLNFDQYLLIKLGYKNQIGVWRKGSS